MNNDLIMSLASKATMELNKHTSIYCGNKSNAAEYVYYEAVRADRMPDYRREESGNDIKAIVAEMRKA